MKFGTTTRIILQDQRARAIEPQLKTLIVGAAQITVADRQHVLQYSDFDESTSMTYGYVDDEGETVILPDTPAYISIYGKGAGKKDAVLLYQSKHVLVEKSAYDYHTEMEALVGEIVETGELLAAPVIVDDEGITVSRYALLTPIYEFYRGSPVHITNDSTNSMLTGLPNDVRSAMIGKNIWVLYYDSGTSTFLYERFYDDAVGNWKAWDTIITSSYVAILEDQFGLDIEDSAYGSLFFNYVYNDDTYANGGIADKVYYIEELDDIRAVFGDSSLNLAPSGAGYNAYMYFLANGGTEGFYVYAKKATAATLYLTAAEVAIALADTVKYKDIYDIIPITHDPDMPGLMNTHLLAMADPDLRKERRGYVGLYMDQGDVYYQYDEFEHLCEIGREGERNYLLGDKEEDGEGGTGRYGGRAAYVTSMINLNGYATNPKLTLCETKNGILSGMYVTAGTLMAIYVAYRRTFLPGYVMAETPLPFISSVTFAGMFSEIDHLDSMQNAGILTIYQATPGAPVTIYYPCTAAPTYPQYAEEYLVTATDQFAREVRASLQPHIARGEFNKTAPGFVGAKAKSYKDKVSSIIGPLKTKYVDSYGVFDQVKLLSVTNNPDYEGGIMMSFQLVYKYAVNHVEVIIYI